MIFESKIREMFKNFRNTPELENIKDRKYAVWALAKDLQWGGPYYLLGSPSHMELWISKDQTSRVSKSKKLIRVKNDAEGYSLLCEALENHIEQVFLKNMME